MDYAFEDYEYEDAGEGGVEYADYYEDESFDPDGMFENGADDINNEESQHTGMSLEELFKYCVIPTCTDSYIHLGMLLSFAFIFLLTSRIFRLPGFLIHFASFATGGALVFQMFHWRVCYMLALYGTTVIALYFSHYCIKRFRGPVTLVTGIVYLVICETYLVTPIWWHAIRGVHMVLLMKVVSIAFDMDSKKIDDLPNVLQIAGYMGNPGTVLFGPWIPYSTYQTVLQPFTFSMSWLGMIVLKVFTSGIFLILSTCFVNWFIPDNVPQLLLAYRDALSFRCSHYFVSYLSEVSSSLAGIKMDSVSKPWLIEMPRSLVEVVIYWNQPMHKWLKSYIFKPSRAVMGMAFAISCTYGVSAIFHGLNFQLAAVLFSLGFYTFTEHGVRKKLSQSLDACIQSRACRECNHKYQSNHLLCIVLNGIFMLIAVLHLAYLGMMFESSSKEETQGYSMFHTLKKWEQLNFFSHWLAFVMYILMAIL